MPLRPAIALLVTLLAAGCRAATPPTATHAPARPEPAVSIAVTYREAANVFEILDNLSGWWSGKCDPEYRAYWKERYGITADDEQRFATYKQIRKRHYPYPTPDEGHDGEVDLFGPTKAVDRFAQAFYAAATLDAAFAELAHVVAADELATLKAFYASYRSSYEPLLAESAVYSDIAAAIGPKLTDARTTTYLDQLARAYGVADLPPFTALYVWWPPVAAIRANNRDRFLLLKYNPTRHRSNAITDFDLPVHEFAHYVSGHQSNERKRALSKAFVKGCDVTADVAPVKILEEPLAVVHQKLFLELADPQHLDFSAPWYGGDAWVSPFAKAIYPQVKEAHRAGRPIDDALMRTMAQSCADLKLARPSAAAPADSASAPPPPPGPGH
jgi:hypothetical protein